MSKSQFYTQYKNSHYYCSSIHVVGVITDWDSSDVSYLVFNDVLRVNSFDEYSP